MADIKFDIKASTNLEDGSNPTYSGSFILPKTEAAFKERFGKDLDIMEMAGLELQRRIANAARTALKEGKTKTEIDAIVMKWTPGQKAQASAASKAKKLVKDLPPDKAAEFEKALEAIVSKYKG